MGLRITKVYTKTGDKGETRLGGGQTVPKDHVRIQAYGTVDELNSVIGLVLAFQPVEETKQALTKIQHELFVIGGELCILDEDKAKFKIDKIGENHVKALEVLIDQINSTLPPLEEFILPGGAQTAAFLHQARCVCRRAETLIVKLAKAETVDEYILKYINRLSDALFVLARYENKKQGSAEVYWQRATKTD